jgi:hypothetical protein
MNTSEFVSAWLSLSMPGDSVLKRFYSEIMTNVEWFPVLSALRQAVSDNEQCLCVDAHTGVAGVDLDVFDPVMSAVLNTGPPMANAIEFAVYRSGGNRRWFAYLPFLLLELIRLSRVLRVKHLVEIRDIRRFTIRVIEWTTHCEDLTHGIRILLCQLPRVDAAKALTDQTDSAAIFIM